MAALALLCERRQCTPQWIAARQHPVDAADRRALVPFVAAAAAIGFVVFGTATIVPSAM